MEPEILEGEFTAEPDPDAGGGDVPIPDDLLAEGEASARYPLPEALVKAQYDVIVTRTAPQNGSIVFYEPDIKARILFATHYLEITDWGYYNIVAERFGDVFPGRIAHLRDLIGRLRNSFEDLQGLQRQAEQERLNLNARNNYTNERIATDLRTAHEEWQRQREVLRDAIRETEEKGIAYRMSRQSELDAARERLYETREKWNRERDERQKAEEERHWREREEDQRAERDWVAQKAVAQSQEHADAWQNATETEQVAQEAEVAAYEAEQEACRRLQSQIQAAEETYDAAFQSALSRLESEEAALREAARQTENDLLNQKREREAELNCVELATHEERAQRERQMTEVRVRAERATAAAGLPPNAAQHKTGLRGAVTEPLTAELVTSQANIGHLAFPEEGGWFHKLMNGLRWLAKYIALIAFGSIFGVSLGLVTHLVDFTDEALQRSDNLLAKIAILCGLSVFIFYLMGRASHKMWAYAEEQLHADRNSGIPPWRGRYLAAVVLASVLVSIFIGLEATVERYGIVGNVMQGRVEGGNLKPATSSDEVAFWTIALIVSLPFVVYHSYAGAMETRYRLGTRSQEHHLSLLHHEALKTPAVITAFEAQRLLEAAQERLGKADEDFAALQIEARRRIAEIETALEENPVIIRWRNFDQNRLTLLHNAPELLKAAEAKDAVREALENDATLKAAKNRAESLRQRADGARQAAEALRHTLNAANPPLLPAPAATTATAATPVANALSATLTWEETLAQKYRASVGNSVSKDPQLAFYKNRVNALQSVIASLDRNHGKRKNELVRQKRVVHVDPQPVEPAMLDQIREAITRVEAVQMAFDEETQRLIQLTDGPALIRWFHNVGQHLFFRSPMRRRLQAAQRRRSLPSRSPAIVNAILPARSEP